MANENRRKHQRVPLMLLVQVRADDYDTFMTKHAPNISQGGLFIETDDLRDEGSLLFFQFTVKDDGPLIEGMGRVVRVVPPDGARRGGLGIEFVNLEEPSRERIDALIDERKAASA